MSEWVTYDNETYDPGTQASAPYNFSCGVTPRQQAELELTYERWLTEVRLAKVQILTKRAQARWWHKLIPFTVTIRRRQS